jgi:hypothetical protein
MVLHAEAGGCDPDANVEAEPQTRPILCELDSEQRAIGCLTMTWAGHA